ncbi:glycosyltransferase involved in cell wall biosynthesis [Microbacterium sp. W4I4]|uniref:glycosyltransferase family 2 protein n=1 Tax=Microbacterium sp. W4I4 TaxID=3042295 RepID=UPI002786BBC8|nr:glycosyltransferase family 2 protein [Microbacterium sp. W4I4]MDQ0613407.1 glycosyltransferase involved in cell wall biosynthesis [Microbacterium sp. W4I4]
MNPLVTMIVPGRDIASFAPAAIASLQAQSEPRWRALLVDDGSVDDTRAVFADAAASDPRFEVLHHHEARGLGAARNIGLDRIDTPFVGFLDADDELAPRALSLWLDALNESGSDFVAGAYVRTRESTGGYRPGRVQPWVQRATSPRRLGVTLAEHPHATANIVAWSKLSRTHVWEHLRFPENVAYEDQIVAQRMYTEARAFDVIPEIVAHWRLRADGTSITQGKNRLPVLHDYLAALRGGIRVLHEAGMTAAVISRLDLILAMDLPPLRQIAQQHPDPAYQAALDAFEGELRALPEYAHVDPDPALAAALAW